MASFSAKFNEEKTDDEAMRKNTTETANAAPLVALLADRFVKADRDTTDYASMMLHRQLTSYGIRDERDGIGIEPGDNQCVYKPEIDGRYQTGHVRSVGRSTTTEGSDQVGPVSHDDGPVAISLQSTGVMAVKKQYVRWRKAQK